MQVPVPTLKTALRLLGPLFFLLAGAAGAATVDQQMAAVENIRGLRFTAPVRTVEIDRAELPAHLRRQFEKSLPYPVGEWGDMLRALRLVAPDQLDDGVVASLLDLYQSQVLAYYDPQSQTFYTVRQLPDALQSMPVSHLFADGINVHEMTHALQDQHFHIGQHDLSLRDDTDAQLAYHALIEGEASLVMLAYLAEQSGGSIDDLLRSDAVFGSLAAAAAMTLPGDGPRYFRELLKVPYLDGLRFVVEAYRRGGWRELDRVHQNPPRSTREILHPADYFEHRFRPTPFSNSPSVPGPILSVEHLGEWHWRFLAGTADGWRSDSVTLARNRFCETTVLAESSWDTPAEARRFFDAYTRTLDDVGWLGAVQGTKVRVAYGADRALMESFVAP